MPLLMCPNDNAPMTTVERSGVQFDMCPTCRGVWLDRGELENLMVAAVNEAPRAATQPARDPGFQQGQQSYGRPPQHGDRDRYHHDRDGYRSDDYRTKKKKKGLDIFDIFD